MSKVNKSVRVKEFNSKKGDISSTFELFNDYSNGNDVDIDLILADDYLNICINQLSGLVEGTSKEPLNKMQLTEATLLYYRKFESIKIEFEKDITIFIGDNGAGKTTILEALAKSFSWINARIIQKGRVGKSLEYSDINASCSNYCEVNTNIKLGENTSFSGSLVKAAKGVESAKSSELDDYHHLSNIYRVSNDRLKNATQKELNIPLLAFYSVERSALKSNSTFDLEKVTETNQFSRFDAIDKTAIDGTGNISDFLQWFIYIDNLANSESRLEISELEKLVSELQKITKKNTSILNDILAKKVKTLEKLKAKTVYSSKEYANVRKIVKKAIIDCHPSITDIYVDRSSGRVEVKVVNDGKTLNIFSISKGQQVFLSLVADLARRLILLNPSLETPLDGQGIVLIDEIELHLHPEWQQNIVSNLLNNFHNIQFIVTTHSPQILSTVASKKIRVLSRNNVNEHIAAKPLAESYARSSSDVLQTIMHVQPTPPFPEKDIMEKYRKLVEQGDFKSNEAKQLQSRLEKALGANHQDLVRLEMVKRRRERLE